MYVYFLIFTKFIMALTTRNWINKKGTATRNCKCGSWAKHWINLTGKTWPHQCSVEGCYNEPTLGAHIYNASVQGERIAPFCDSCNKREGTFNLKGDISVPFANKAITCEL